MAHRHTASKSRDQDRPVGRGMTFGPGAGVFIVVCALLVFLALQTGQNLLYAAFGLMVGAMLTSIGVSWLMLRRLTVQRLAPAHGVAGQAVNLRYRVENNSAMWPVFGLVVSETWTRQGQGPGRPPSHRREGAGRDRLGHVEHDAAGDGHADFASDPSNPVAASRHRSLQDAPSTSQAGEAHGLAEVPETRLTRSELRRRVTDMLGGPPSGWILHIGPKQTGQAEAVCWPRHRGMLRLQRIRITLSFPFNLVSRSVQFEQPGQVLIYPSLYRLQRQLVSRLNRVDPMGSRRHEKPGGQEEFYGLRAYREGDPLRSIDWRRSAKTGSLVCRERTQSAPPRIMIGLDLTDAPTMRAQAQAIDARQQRWLRRLWNWWFHPQLVKKPPAIQTADQTIERAVSLAASVICEAHFQGYQTGLVVLGVVAEAFPVHRSLPHRTRLLEALAMLDVSRPAQANAAIGGEASITVRLRSQGRVNSAGRSRLSELAADQFEHYVQADRSDLLLLLGRGRPLQARSLTSSPESAAGELEPMRRPA